jgi:hypothetical protein
MSLRVLVLDNGAWHDVFDVLEVNEHLIRARSPFLFEIGEELKVRIERGGDSATELRARVRGHAGPDDDRVTELELARGGAP